MSNIWFASFIFSPADVSEDPFSFHQDESLEGFNSNLVVENLLQRNKDLSFTTRSNQEGVFSRSARSFITDEILEALRKADRKGRDVVVGLSNACCKWGCSKSEISSLCWGLICKIWMHKLADSIFTLKQPSHKYAHTISCSFPFQKNLDLFVVFHHVSLLIQSLYLCPKYTIIFVYK